MATVVSDEVAGDVVPTVADLLEQLGGVPPERVLLRPTPGQATEEDLLWLLDHKDLICELIDGVLVAKPMGARESLLAVFIIVEISDYLKTHKLGIVLGEAGTLRILPTQIREPDVCFISYERLTGSRFTKVPVPAVVPDLAIEVLSEGNRPGEMKRKLNDYFEAGVRLVWYIDPDTRTATVHRSPADHEVLDETKSLDGGDVLPGFTLSLHELFAELDRLEAGPSA